MIRLRQLLGAAACAVALASPVRVRAHDLPGTSATLIVRDGGFVDLRLMVPWSDILREQWMPRASREVFLGTITNQPAATFAREYNRVIATIERNLQLVANRTRVIAFRHWKWPTATEVQSALRTELMARLTASSSDHHSERLLATADGICDSPLAEVQLQLAALLGPVLVTAYRPTEQLVAVGGRSVPMPVGRR